MNVRRLKLLTTVAVAACGLSVAAVGASVGADATAAPPVGRTNSAVPTRIITPEKVSLPPALAQVVRLSEAGVSNQAITDYIQKSANAYTIDADQIVYLHDLGISDAVLNALVSHSGTIASEGPATESSTAGNPANETAANNPSEAPPVSGAATQFYDSLAPYGSWLYVPTYGWCWQPTVAVVDSGWLPYCNNGSWLWTDDGWYWNSYYSWGWAPFHYGRWCQYPGYGWLWCPDNTWGPAWVCWRDYPGYCGWAPLPPGAYFTVGLGWTYNGVAVGFNYGFGLGYGAFTFCDYDNFYSRHPFHYFRHGREARRFFAHSRVDNAFSIGPHHRFFNRGIDPSRIERATHTRIRQVAVRELPSGAAHARAWTGLDRLTRSGNSSVIYRPGRNISIPRNPYLPGRESRTAGRRNVVSAEHGFAGGRAAARAPRFETARPNGTQRVVPENAPSFRRPNVIVRGRNGGGGFRFTRPETAPGYQAGHSRSQFAAPARSLPPRQRSAAARPLPPAQHFAPAWHAAPARPMPRAPARSAPRSFSRPAPSFGGSHFQGGGGHVGGGMYFGGGAHGGGRDFHR